jgi:DNA mismatch repair protein MutS2
MARRTAQEVLEFDKLIAILCGYATCAPGRRHIAALAPVQQREALEASFALQREAVAYLRSGSELGFGALADPEPWLERLAVPSAVLAPRDLLDAASLGETTAWLRQAFKGEREKYPLLAARVATLPDLGSVTAAIRRAILPNGDVADEASSELKRIRATMARTRDTVQKQLQALLRARAAGRESEGAEDYVTIRNDRFVIPVRAQDRREVPGVVHGWSATGQTLFVEPFETVELNNQLVQLAEDEAAEIARILSLLTGRLREQLTPLRAAADLIAELDSTFARARFAREFNATAPEFTAERRLQLDGARHPILEAKLRKEGRAIVPISLALGGSENVLVISGPNTGGKTVSLKTVGLAALSAQAGIPVAAERAVLPLFDAWLVDIGDEQSIAADLSTFSAHVLNLREMLAAATPHSLVLVDELGTGTAPEEGSALAVALLEAFRERGCLTLGTTHHDRLKTYASTTPGILNAAVEFDDVNLRPTYRLLIGVPGVSRGLHIAERLGLAAAVIERARAELSPEAREAGDLIAWLHRSRNELEQMKREAAAELARLEEERRKLQTEWAERQRKRLADLEQKFVETLKQYEDQIRQLIGEVKDRQLRAQLEKQAIRRVAKARTEAREEANAAVLETLAAAQADLGPAATPSELPVTPAALVPGARVRVRGFRQPVVLKQRDERAAEIQAGLLRMRVRLDDITAVLSEEPGEPARPGAASVGRSISVSAQPGEDAAVSPDEINVIGCTVEEASRRVDKFLDDAALAGKPQVRIIHGHGTGALRRGLAEFLSAHPLVEGLSAEAPERGGTAVTVVHLKT